MVASLLKILVTGIQDERLSFGQNIKLEPFLKVFRRSGRFTTQWYRIDFDVPPQFGQQAQFRIRRLGHLCMRLFVVLTMPDLFTLYQKFRSAAIANGASPTAQILPQFGWTNSLGHAIIQEASIYFANERLDTIDSRLLEILDEFNTPLENLTAVNRLIARNDSNFTPDSFGKSLVPQQIIIPLPFWFSRGDPAAALPTDAISKDEMRVNLQIRDITGLYYTYSRNLQNTSQAQGTSLWPLLSSQMYYTDNVGSIIPGLSPTNQPVKPIPGQSMPSGFSFGDSYVLAEYVYLDEPEANAFRLADLYVPITQHYILNPVQTYGNSQVSVDLDIGNCIKDIYWMVQREEAPSYNAHFLATNDLINAYTRGQVPWWPDSSGLVATEPLWLKPGFAYSNSEPIQGVAVVYEGHLTRTRSMAPVIYRTILPVMEQKKSPWVNRYYYNYPFGVRNSITPQSAPNGEANFDRMKRRELRLTIAPKTGSINRLVYNPFVVYTYAESLNILRIYSGRAGLLFAY